MTLSDAMRLGAAMTEQCFGDLFQRDGFRITRACAWGSLLIGAGKVGCNPTTVYRDFPELIRCADCPIAGCGHAGYFGEGMTMDELITHLNDDHRWTREAIADWIDTLSAENENATEEICAAV